MWLARRCYAGGIHARPGTRSDQAAVGPDRPAGLPLLLGTPPAHVRRSRHVTALRELRSCGAARGDGAVLSAARPGLRAMPAGAARGVRRTGGDLHRIRLLLLLLGLLGRPRPRVRRVGGGALRARWKSQVVEVASNDGYLLQHCRRARGSRRSGSSRRANVAEAARERGIETVVEFFGRRARAAGWCARAARRTCWSRNNVFAQVPDLNDFIAGMKLLLAPTGRGHARVPHLAAADRAEPVRHHLPRALLLLLVPHRPERVSPPTGSRSSTSTSCRPMAARCGVYAQQDEDGGRPVSERVDELAAREREPAGPPGGIRGVRASVDRDQVERCSSFLIACRRDGQARRRLRRPGQGQHAAQLLRHPHRLPRFHGRSQSVQAGAVPARARRSPSATPRRSSRPGRITSSILPWNLTDEIVAQLANVRDGAAASSSPIPEVRVLMKVVLFCGGSGTSDAGGVRNRAQADGPDRHPPGPLARDEVLRPLRHHRFRALPGLQGRGDQAVLPHLQRGDGERLRAHRRRRGSPPAEDRHPRLEHHVRRHRAAGVDRRAAAGRAPPAGRGRVRSSRTTGTC